MTDLNPVDAMTTDCRTICAELVEAYAWCIEEYMTAPAEEDSLIQRARALLAQPVAAEPTIPSSTLHRQELTPSEVTLLNTFWRSR